MKAALAALILAACPAITQAACQPEHVELRTPTGAVRFTVEIADDAVERAQGLMFRESLPRSAGMLFVYEHPQSASFWMRNTLIPLDIIFMDPAGRVRNVHANARPRDETPIPGGDGILAVLEINGGLAARLGIAEGSVMRSPLLDQATAAWPCTD